MSTVCLLSDEELGQLAPIGIKLGVDRAAFLRQLALAFKGKSCTKKCYYQLRRAMLELAASSSDIALKNLEIIKTSESLERQEELARVQHVQDPSSADFLGRYNVSKSQNIEFRKSLGYKTALRFKNRMLSGITPDDIDKEIRHCVAEEATATTTATADSPAMSAPATVADPVNDYLGMSFASAARDATVGNPLEFIADDELDLVEDEPDIPTARLLNKTTMKRFIQMQAKNNDSENQLSESMLVERFLREAKEKHAELAKKRREGALKKKEQAHKDDDDDDDDNQKRKRQKRDRSVTTDYASLYFVLFGPMSNHFKFGYCFTILCERMRHYMPGEGPPHLVWRVIINAGANTRQTTQTIEGHSFFYQFERYNYLIIVYLKCRQCSQKIGYANR